MSGPSARDLPGTLRRVLDRLDGGRWRDLLGRGDGRGGDDAVGATHGDDDAVRATHGGDDAATPRGGATPAVPTTTGDTADDAPRILFVHIPRTGGTTIEALMRERLPGRVFPGYADGPVVVSPQRRLRTHQLYLGHQLYYIRDLVRPDFTFTFVREPVERARSLWALMHDVKPERLDQWDGFMDCARSFPHMQNHQVRFLSASYDVRRVRAELAVGSRRRQDVRREVKALRGDTPVGEVELEMAKAAIDDMDFVGVFEDFEPGVRALFDRLGHPVDGPLPRARTSSRPKQAIASIDDDEREELRRLNRLDLELHAYATERYHRDVGA